MRFPFSAVRHGAILFAAALSIALAPRAGAVLIVGNFAEPFRAATPIGNPEFWAAQSFSTDAEYTLTSIAAIMGNAAGDPDAVIELRADASGTIDTSAGGLLATFSVPDLSGPFAARSFTPSAAITLSAGVPYWFVVGATSGGFDWAYADTNFYDGPGALQPFADSNDAGATWSVRDLVFPYFIEVHGEVVPEPGTLLLAGLGLAGLGARRRAARGTDGTAGRRGGAPPAVTGA